MADVTNSPAPGDMTVPLLSGWEGLGIGMLLLGVLAVAFLLLAAARPGAGNRPEWQAWLDARSSGPGAAPADLGDRAAAPGGTSAGE